eukprot:8396540-Alexandrium_andersonii.AAC.1
MVASAALAASDPASNAGPLAECVGPPRHAARCPRRRQDADDVAGTPKEHANADYKLHAQIAVHADAAFL